MADVSEGGKNAGRTGRDLTESPNPKRDPEQDSNHDPEHDPKHNSGDAPEIDGESPAVPGPDLLRGWGADLALAASFLTRLPFRLSAANGARPLSRAVRAFPLIGLGVGVVASAVYVLAAQIGLAPLAAALTALGSSALLTGALHEDGLADVADGFGGGKSREDKLDIMRDSRIGAYGVLALVFSLGLRAALIAGVAATAGTAGAIAAIIAAAMGSRAVLPLAMGLMPPARETGLGAAAGQPDTRDIFQAGVIGAIAVLVLLGVGSGLVGVLVVAGVFFLFSALARAQVGGQTGDVLGAHQQLAEISLLIAAAAG